MLAFAMGATIASALPAFAGPSGSSVPSYFPLHQQLSAPHDEEPHGLLGDTERSNDTRSGRDDVRVTPPASGWQRRPSEGK
jgi:hypothetical protein